MTTLELDKIQKRIEGAFKSYSSTKNYKLIPSTLTTGKIYEAYVLSLVLKNLKNIEGLYIVLINDQNLKLQSSPGKIHRDNPRFDVYRSKSDFEIGEHTKFAEIWTDVEFVALSHEKFRSKRKPNSGEYHELDIMMTIPNPAERPWHEQVILGVECKNTAYNKNLLREILGVRRELSLLKHGQATLFKNWPRAIVNAEPASCLMAYSTDSKISHYSSPGQEFSIDFLHAPI